MANTPYHHFQPRAEVRYVVAMTREAVPMDCKAENQASLPLLSCKKCISWLNLVVAFWFKEAENSLG
jgi:hypothetical protein